MTKKLDTAELNELAFYVKDNKWALKLCLDVLYVGHLWDDLIDGDVRRGVDDVNKAFVKMFRDIPNNPFVMALPPQAQWQLHGLMASAAMQFEHSTRLEIRDDTNDRMLAWVLRNTVKAIVHYIVYLVGGSEWIDEHGPNVWRMFNMREDWEGFVEEGVNVNLIR